MSDISRLMELAREAGVTIRAPVNVDVPAIVGSGVIGEAITCTMGNWEGEPTEYAYAWFLDSVDTGAVGETYTPVAGNEGHAVTCVVSATNGAGTGSAPHSNPIVVTAVAARAAPERAVPKNDEPAHRDAHVDARRDRR